MPTLLFAAFIVYLYAPFLIFKFFAEESIDLGRQKDLGRVEEFFSAALPSAVLNMGAYALVRVGFWVNTVTSPLPTVAFGIDWRVAAGALDPTLAPLRAHFRTLPFREFVYVSTLYLFSAAAGRTYGYIELKLLERGAESAFFLRGLAQRRFRWFFALLFRRVWLPFFAERIGQVVAWSSQDTWMFVRTNADRLYYGFFWDYTKDASGELETISLIRVQRYSRGSVRDALKNGRSPLSRLSGTFVLKWSEVTDVNVTPPEIMLAIRRAYAQELRTYRAEKRTRRWPRLLRALKALASRRKRRSPGPKS